MKKNKTKKLIRAEISELITSKVLTKEQLIDIFEFINKVNTKNI